jgi:hypothetical protein
MALYTTLPNEVRENTLFLSLLTELVLGHLLVAHFLSDMDGMVGIHFYLSSITFLSTRHANVDQIRIQRKIKPEKVSNLNPYKDVIVLIPKFSHLQ